MKIYTGKEASKYFDAAYSDMLEQFPPSELKSRAAFETLISGDNYDFGVVCGGCGEMLSYYTCYIVESMKIGLLDHFAVVKKMHSKGIGGNVLKFIREHYSNLKGLILEVEKPEPENPNTIRRVNFYKRCGAYMLDMDYLLPAPGNTAVPMALMFLNCGNFSGIISKEEIISALKPVFENLHASSFENSKEVYSSLLELWKNK